jgi:hypothetical protein
VEFNEFHNGVFLVDVDLRFEISNSRFFRRMSFGEQIVDFLHEGASALGIVGEAAGFFREMALSLNVGILQMVCPGTKLAGARLCHGFQIGDLRFEILQRGSALEKAEHGANLPGGPACYIKELKQLVRAAALEAFGNIIGDGKGCAVELVAFGPGNGILGGQEEILTFLGKKDGLFPDWQIFKAVVGGHESENLKFQI